MDLGRLREAVPSYRRAIDIYGELEETEHERYAITSMGYGAALGLLGDFESARVRLQLALDVNRRIMPEGSEQTVKNLLLLGALLARVTGRDEGATGEQKREILDSARGHLQEALDSLERSSEGANPLAAGVMAVAAGVAEAEGRHDDASSLRARSDAVRMQVFLTADAEFIGQGTLIFAARGLYDEAELYGRRVLELRRSTPDADLEVADAEFALGRLLALRGRDEDAARHLKKALDLREAILGQGDPATELVRECLAYVRGDEG
jgi:tetratricopeptide (TPR) repeat protein